jgi:hypothetical protein
MDFSVRAMALGWESSSRLVTTRTLSAIPSRSRPRAIASVDQRGEFPNVIKRKAIRTAARHDAGGAVAMDIAVGVERDPLCKGAAVFDQDGELEGAHRRTTVTTSAARVTAVYSHLVRSARKAPLSSITMA